MANPVIEAIDAGHVNHGNVCRFDQEAWPCAQILRCREQAKRESDVAMQINRLRTPMFLAAPTSP